MKNLREALSSDSTLSPMYSRAFCAVLATQIGRWLIERAFAAIQMRRTRRARLIAECQSSVISRSNADVWIGRRVGLPCTLSARSPLTEAFYLHQQTYTILQPCATKNTKMRIEMNSVWDEQSEQMTSDITLAGNIRPSTIDADRLRTKYCDASMVLWYSVLAVLPRDSTHSPGRLQQHSRSRHQSVSK